jgi:glycosyltransferase involved in cell wall biosynthesis
MALSLSTIICTKDRPDDLDQCLKSILKGNRLPNEIIIIDDGNLDINPLRELVANYNISLIYRRKATPGLTASRNLAVSIASGDVLSFLDDDVILDQTYYNRVMEAFEQDSSHSIVGVTGAIKVQTHPIKRMFLRFFGLESGQPGKVQACGAVTLVRAGEIDQPVRVEWLSGCNMNFRRWVFENYRFDEQDSGYVLWEDRDFTYPIGQKHILIALPDATLIHKKSSVSRDSAKNLGRMEIFHLGRFFLAHRSHNNFNWIALGWAFVGIALKNFLTLLSPPKRAISVQQLAGNFKGFLQFIAFLKENYGKISQD